MTDLSGARIVVGGGGVFGSAVALALARAGAKVVLADPAALGANASGVAAGMLAPAFESALDPVSAGHYTLLKAARDLWPAFIADMPELSLDRAGATFVADEGEVEAVLARLSRVGASAVRQGAGLFTSDDWRLDPQGFLAAMRARLLALGGLIANVAVETLIGESEATVLACGYGGRDLAPELAVLKPIKGQILRFKPQDLGAGGVRRGPGGYVAPGPSGVLAGSTMEAGVSDTLIDPAASARLHAMALSLAPELEGQSFIAAAGVRAATPDGLPLVGPSARPGVYLAAGARRNGWLLAPLAAQILVEKMGGRGDHPFAAALGSGRFSRPG